MLATLRTLKRSGTGDLSIKRENNNILVHSSEPILCTISEEGSLLVIEGLAISNICINGGNFSVSVSGSGQSISVINGQVFVNGKLQGQDDKMRRKKLIQDTRRIGLFPTGKFCLKKSHFQEQVEFHYLQISLYMRISN